MARKIDFVRLRSRSTTDLDRSLKRFASLPSKLKHEEYLILRWAAAMSAVEIHGIWERYVEERLTSLINHNPSQFASLADIRGLKSVSSGLAKYIIRGGGRYFDFKSTSDLLGKGDGWLGRAHNPFRSLSQSDREYIDLLSAIRNCVVHGSDAAQFAYRRHLKTVYGIRSAPEPDEFLNAVDHRNISPAPKEKRIRGIATIIRNSINST